jgi:hypothetical protein
MPKDGKAPPSPYDLGALRNPNRPGQPSKPQRESPYTLSKDSGLATLQKKK